MILRRFKKHIQEENWFAVSVDFLVVVVGIFVGLQVEGWNEDRKAKITAQDQIVQLIEDTKISISDVQRMMDFEEGRISSFKLVLKVMEDKILPPDQLETFNQGLSDIYKMAPANIAIGLLSPILAGDDLELRTIPRINTALLAFELEMKYNIKVIDHVIVLLNMSTPVLNKYVAGKTEVSIPGYEVQYDLEHLKNSTEFIYAFQNALVMHSNRKDFALENKKALKKLLTELEEIP